MRSTRQPDGRNHAVLDVGSPRPPGTVKLSEDGDGDRITGILRRVKHVHGNELFSFTVHFNSRVLLFPLLAKFKAAVVVNMLSAVSGLEAVIPVGDRTKLGMMSLNELVRIRCLPRCANYRHLDVRKEKTETRLISTRPWSRTQEELRKYKEALE
ncbi:hypothetical protein OSTOST_05665 [Ostertagia ostertagi]